MRAVARLRTFRVECRRIPLRRKLDGVFEQARRMRFDRAPVGCGPTGKLGLNLGSDIDRDRHGVPFGVNLFP
jgi:hypothetical protein